MHVNLSDSEWKLMNHLWARSPQTITELTAVLRAETGLPLQQCYSVKDNVIKVQRVSSHQFFLVGGIDFCNPGRCRRKSPCTAARSEPAVRPWQFDSSIPDW